MDEFSLIEHYFRRASRRDDVVRGIGDDAAILTVPNGMELVMTMDTLVADVHFPADTSASDIAYKSVAVNLSDLAAMGAQPAWLTLALTLPDDDADWLQSFSESFLDACAAYDIELVGGDTTHGPLSISVHACGHIEQGAAMRRDTASAGQDIWVTGSLGDAAMALQLLDSDDQSLRHRLDRPQARVAFARDLVKICRCAIDISDGLLADVEHILKASACAANIDAASLPLSAALLKASASTTQARQLALSGGDDYELCFIVDASMRQQIQQLGESHGLDVTRIGETIAGEGVNVICDDDELQRSIANSDHGYRHFG